MSVPAQASRRIPEFDGLRGCAISLVIWHHLAEPFLPFARTSWLGWVRAASSLSWCGVDLFFVLSGFFIGGILLDHRGSLRLARVFYLRRALRILPVYYLTLAAILAFTAIGTPYTGHAFPCWVYPFFLSNLYQAGLQNWDWPALGVLWSICVEEQFYLAAPWVVRFLSPAIFPWMMIALVFTAWVLRVLMAALHPTNLVGMHVLMPFRMDGFALGALVAWACRAETARGFWLGLGRTWARWLILAFMLVVGLALFRPKQGDLTLAAGGYTLLALVFALTVAVIAGPRPVLLTRLLAWRPLVLLGRHSYFIYLWHFFLGLTLIEWWGGPHYQLNRLPALIILAGAVAAVWGLAALSWRFLESPLIQRGHRHSY